MRVDVGYTLPRRSTIESGGYDFFLPYDLEMKPGEYYKIGTGVHLDGTERMWMNTSRFGPIAMDFWTLQLYPRSGFGTKYGFSLRNTVGIVDQDYRGEIEVTVSVTKPLTIKKGKPFMQGIITPVLRMSFEIEPTEERGEGGFGSTDKK